MRPEGFEFRAYLPNCINDMLDLRLYFLSATEYKPAEVYAERVNTGYGLERATLGISVWNNGPSTTNVTWLEEWPAWIKVYMHTMRVTVNDRPVATGEHNIGSKRTTIMLTDSNPIQTGSFTR
jgi:hypothetical protein